MLTSVPAFQVFIQSATFLCVVDLWPTIALAEEVMRMKIILHDAAIVFDATIDRVG